jgi:hypothetical protein
MSQPDEHAVLVYIKLSDDNFGGEQERAGLHKLEDQLTAAIDSCRAGEFDGDEFGGGFCTLYMYGPNADKLAEAVLPILRQFHAPVGSYVVKRYGPATQANARQEKIQLD